jgi:hypothetical protein
MASKAKITGNNDSRQRDGAVAERERSLHSSREQKIRFRAYEIYLQRGGQTGSELEDWLQAERELTTTGSLRT